MWIENTIAATIQFLHMDALSAAVPLRIDFDLQLALMASALYRRLALRLGPRFRSAEPATLLLRFVHAAAIVDIGSEQITVTLGRRAHNPHLLEAGFANSSTPIPCLHNLPLQIDFA